jgi:hypothetical protein
VQAIQRCVVHSGIARARRRDEVSIRWRRHFGGANRTSIIREKQGVTRRTICPHRGDVVVVPNATSAEEATWAIHWKARDASKVRSDLNIAGLSAPLAVYPSPRVLADADARG